MKKRRYLVKVFGIQGRAVDDATLRWVIDEFTGHDAIQRVKEQLQLANGLTDFEIAQYSLSADYLEDA